jgi:CheY-like chemotaxis protein
MKLLEAHPPRILIADDDPGTIAIFRQYVAALGWDADYCSTAREIVELVNRNCDCAADHRRCYDAIVSDVNFFDERPGGPRVSGVAAARAIRGANPTIPIVFVTAYNSYLVREAAAGVDAEVIEKPVDFDDLFSRVAYLIRFRRVAAIPPTERRQERENRTDYARRAGDRPVKIPAILETLLADVRAARERRPLIS